MIRITIPERLTPHHAPRESPAVTPSDDLFRHELCAQGSGVHPKPTRPRAKLADGAEVSALPALPAIPAPPAMHAIPAMHATHASALATTAAATAAADPTSDPVVSIGAANVAPTSEVAMLSGAPTPPAAQAPPTKPTPVASADGAIELAPLGLAPITLPMTWIPPTPVTPLEQAIQDLIARLAPTTSRGGKGGTDPGGDAPDHATSPTGTTLEATAAPAPQIVGQPRGPMAPLHAHATPEPRAIPEMPSATSHVHLVVGDDAERVVVTVAVRGAQVTTTLRTSDDQTAAALSRNAGSLDDAMRARGLVLAELDANHDHHPPPRQPAQRDPDRAPPNPDTEPFALDEEA